jgi:hypothetical protein
MKKEISLMMLFLSATYLIAQTQVVTEKGDTVFVKKYVVGLSAACSGTNNFGGGLRLDYLLKEKLSVGLRSFYASNRWKDESNSDYSIKYHSGNITNFFLGATYHVLGNNNIDNKIGVYGTAGIGYQSWTMSETVAFTNAGYNGYDSDFGYQTVSLLLSPGGEYKIGPGKVFLDVPVVFDMYNLKHKRELKYTSGTESDQGTKAGVSDFTISFLAVSLGYIYYF